VGRPEFTISVEAGPTAGIPLAAEDTLGGLVETADARCIAARTEVIDREDHVFGLEG
jgi:hypothetical protein